MECIDGEKVEAIIKTIYAVFEKYHVTANEGAAIAGMIMVNASAGVTALEAAEEEVEGDLCLKCIHRFDLGNADNICFHCRKQISKNPDEYEYKNFKALKKKGKPS